MPRKSTGRRSRATPEYRAALHRAVQTQPPTLGYRFSVWSVARLNAHLHKETGLSFGDDRLRAILREEGFSFQRPKHPMKGKHDEVAYEKSRRALYVSPRSMAAEYVSDNPADRSLQLASTIDVWDGYLPHIKQCTRWLVIVAATSGDVSREHGNELISEEWRGYAFWI